MKHTGFEVAGLVLMERPRERGDLIQAFKINKSLTEMRCPRGTLFEIRKNYILRGNGKAFVREHGTSGLGSKSFAILVVNDCNSYPGVVVLAKTEGLDNARLVVFGEDRM